MRVFVVWSDYEGPQAVFKERQWALEYCRKVSGGSLFHIKELKIG